MGQQHALRTANRYGSIAPKPVIHMPPTETAERRTLLIVERCRRELPRVA
jgi:hypothetical protein